MNTIEKAMAALEKGFERAAEDERTGLHDTRRTRLSDDQSARLRDDELTRPCDEQRVQPPVDQRGQPHHDTAHRVSLEKAATSSAEPLVGVAANADTVPAERETQRLTLPMERLKAGGMITPDAPRSRIAEEYRTIKRPLLQNIRSSRPGGGEPANVIMVTSCLEGEGKTFSAINLAMSLSMERNRRVLLIDCDVAKGAASKLLGIGRDETGLTNVLLDSTIDINDCTWHTDIDNLACVPAGSASEMATELLGSDRMRELIHELSRSDPDRIILFDTPPVLQTNEALVLTRQVGQIAFVVAAERTTHGMVSDALNRIEGTALIGLVLNRTRKKFGAGSYGYGYGYGHGSANEPPHGQGPIPHRFSDRQGRA